MKKLEIILSQSVEEDFFSKCKRKNVCKAYTKIDNVMGEGLQVPKMGTPIWPQLNSMIIVVCSDSEANEIKRIVIDLRLDYPDDGIFCTITDVQVI